MTQTLRELLSSVLLVALAGLVVALSWWMAAEFLGLSEFILPGPGKTIEELMSNLDKYLEHGISTTTAAMIALVLAIGFAVVASSISSTVGWVQNIIEPILVFIQIIPKVALIPLFLIWFGFGVSSKAMMAFLICFFPVFISTFLSMKRQASSELNKSFRLMGEADWRRTLLLDLPSSLPSFFSGLRASALLAVVGVLVSELVGSSAGLGYLVIEATGRAATTEAFAAILASTIVGFGTYIVVLLVEHFVLLKLHLRYDPK